ncbi:unnamed protein product, partial [Ectocarpus fasciculatus]
MISQMFSGGKPQILSLTGLHFSHVFHYVDPTCDAAHPKAFVLSLQVRLGKGVASRQRISTIDDGERIDTPHLGDRTLCQRMTSPFENSSAILFLFRAKLGRREVVSLGENIVGLQQR